MDDDEKLLAEQRGLKIAAGIAKECTITNADALTPSAAAAAMREIIVGTLKGHIRGYEVAIFEQPK